MSTAQQLESDKIVINSFINDFINTNKEKVIQILSTYNVFSEPTVSTLLTVAKERGDVFIKDLYYKIYKPQAMEMNLKLDNYTGSETQESPSFGMMPMEENDPGYTTVEVEDKGFSFGDFSDAIKTGINFLKDTGVTIDDIKTITGSNKSENPVSNTPAKVETKSFELSFKNPFVIGGLIVFALIALFVYLKTR
jgi:hypothetical protein